MNDLVRHVRTFLLDSGFEIGGERGQFELVGQNSSVIVFLIDAGMDLETARRRVLNVLTRPFQTKRFGPKSMEMYCVFVADAGVSLALVEKCEQDIRVCRKIVVTGPGEMETRLSFLRPLVAVMEGSHDVSSLFWTELRQRLTEAQVEFLKEVGGVAAAPEDLANRIPPRS